MFNWIMLGISERMCVMDAKEIVMRVCVLAGVVMGSCLLMYAGGVVACALLMWGKWEKTAGNPEKNTI